MKHKEVRVIVCRVGKEPEVETFTLDYGDQRERGKAQYHALCSIIEGCSDASRLWGEVCVVFSDDGIEMKQRTNRWGILGDFFLCRYDQHGNMRSLTDNDITRLMPLLRDEDWLMKNHPAHQPFLFMRSGKRADEWEQEGHTFDPQLHFTGPIAEVGAVQRLIDGYADHLEAWFCGNLPGGYSAELQFRQDQAGQEAMSRCLAEYQRLKPVPLTPKEQAEKRKRMRRRNGG